MEVSSNRRDDVSAQRKSQWLVSKSLGEWSRRQTFDLGQTRRGGFQDGVDAGIAADKSDRGLSGGRAFTHLVDRLDVNVGESGSRHLSPDLRHIVKAEWELVECRRIDFEARADRIVSR